MFQAKYTRFVEQLNTGGWSLQDQVDMVFEFKAYMLEEITRAQQRVSNTNSFTFYGSSAANEAGHIATLTNQLRAVLHDVRMMALGYQQDADISTDEKSLRKCPHCGEIR